MFDVRFLLVTLLVLTVVAAPTRSSATTASGRTEIEATNAALFRLPGIRDLGRATATQPVRVVLVLRYHHDDELKRLIQLQTAPGGIMRGRFLTNAEFAEYFSPTLPEYRTVANSLRNAGFRIDEAFDNRTIIVADGPAAVAARYFHTQFDEVFQRGFGIRYANMTQPTVPADISPIVLSVVGLNNIIAMTPANSFAPAAIAGPIGVANSPTPRPVALDTQGFSPFTCASPPAQPGGFLPSACLPSPSPSPNPTPTPSPQPTPTPYPANCTDSPLNTSGPTGGPRGGVNPVVFALAYDMPVLHNCAGNYSYPTGIIVDGDFHESDLTAFLNFFGITRTGAATSRWPSDGGGVGGDNLEATLDAETTVGLAPNTYLNMYEISSLANSSVIMAYNRVVNDNRVAVESSSFGTCEAWDHSFDQSIQQIVDQGDGKGITFAAATGDEGLYKCDGGYTGLEAPAASPNIVAVGGTSPANGPLWLQQYGWNGSGGGTSIYYAKYPYQSQVCGGTMRCIPDIAFAADPSEGYALAVYMGGGWQGPVGGTSLASPMYAAMQSEIDERQKRRLGLVLNRLYNIFGVAAYGCYNAQQNGIQCGVFSDITSGNNGAPAGPGWDFVTGIGITDGYKLSSSE
jgi:subtilase family serine protease